MKRYWIFLILTVLPVFAVSVFSAHAQEINVDSLDNEQLATLLLQIMQQLEQTGEAAETPEPTPTPTPEPAKAALPELSDDKAELEALLKAIMQKLQEDQEETAATAEASASETEPEPAGDPPSFTIYENKKLIIEKLPEYMFIQPTEPPKPEKKKPDSPKDSSNPTGGDRDSYCTSKCMGHSDFYGIDMLDMGCYAKCMGDI